MSTAYPKQYELLFRNRDDEIEAQKLVNPVEMVELIEQCENLRVLQEIFVNSVEEPVVIYTRA